MELIGELDFALITYLEARASRHGQRPTLSMADMFVASPLATPQYAQAFTGAHGCRNPFGSQGAIQSEALDLVTFALGDDDARVREAAGTTLGKLVPRLFYTSDWPGAECCLKYIVFCIYIIPPPTPPFHPFPAQTPLQKKSG